MGSRGCHLGLPPSSHPQDRIPQEGGDSYAQSLNDEIFAKDSQRGYPLLSTEGRGEGGSDDEEGRGRERGEEGGGGGAVGHLHTRCLCVCVCARVRACVRVVVVWCLYLKIPPPPGTSGDRSVEDLSILIMPSSITPLISMTPCHARARAHTHTHTQED
jgi:hypothetical protein